MTTVISRLYDSADTAQAVAGKLHDAGFPADTVDVLTDGSVEALRAARLSGATSEAIAPHMTKGRALVVVRAPFTPIGAARRAMDIVDEHASVDMGIGPVNEYIREEPDHRRYFSSILSDHRLFLSSDMKPGTGRYHKTMSEIFGLRLLSKNRTRRSAISGGAFMSTKFLPFRLLSKRKDRKLSVIRGRPLSDAMGVTPPELRGR